MGLFQWSYDQYPNYAEYIVFFIDNMTHIWDFAKQSKSMLLLEGL